jgi:hypothetical protein
VHYIGTGLFALRALHTAKYIVRELLFIPQTQTATYNEMCLLWS